MAALDVKSGIRAKLDAERTKLLGSFADLPRAIVERRTDGDWSVRDILAHIVMGESVNMRFARIVVEKDSPSQLHELAREFPGFPGEFDLDRFNAWMTERWQTKSLEEIIAALHRTRAETLAWLETLTSEQLERRGTHAVWGDHSVKDLFRILAIHEKAHRGDIEKRTQL